MRFVHVTRGALGMRPLCVFTFSSDLFGRYSSTKWGKFRDDTDTSRLKTDNSVVVNPTDHVCNLWNQRGGVNKRGGVNLNYYWPYGPAGKMHLLCRTLLSTAVKGLKWFQETHNESRLKVHSGKHRTDKKNMDERNRHRVEGGGMMAAGWGWGGDKKIHKLVCDFYFIALSHKIQYHKYTAFSWSTAFCQR